MLERGLVGANCVHTALYRNPESGTWSLAGLCRTKVQGCNTSCSKFRSWAHVAWRRCRSGMPLSSQQLDARRSCCTQGLTRLAAEHPTYTFARPGVRWSTLRLIQTTSVYSPRPIPVALLLFVVVGVLMASGDIRHIWAHILGTVQAWSHQFRLLFHWLRMCNQHAVCVTADVRCQGKHIRESERMDHPKVHRARCRDSTGTRADHA